MKKVIYQKASREVIHVEDVDEQAIIGYVSRDSTMVKGFLVKGKTKFRGVNVCIDGAAVDVCPPVPSRDLISLDLDMPNFIANSKDEWDFFKFNSIKELINWLAT